MRHHQGTMYASRRQAASANPDWCPASEIMRLIGAKYGFQISPTNIGNIAIRSGLETVDFVRFMDGINPKVGHLYNPHDLDIYAYFAFYLAVQRRMILSNETIGLIRELDDKLVNQSVPLVHTHHKIPRHAGGTDDASNLEQLTVFEHACAHRKLYEEYGRYADLWAWRKLLVLCFQKN